MAPHDELGRGLLIGVAANWGQSFSLRLWSINPYLLKLFGALSEAAPAVGVFFRMGGGIGDLVDRFCGELLGAQHPVRLADALGWRLHSETKLYKPTDGLRK